MALGSTLNRLSLLLKSNERVRFNVEQPLLAANNASEPYKFVAHGFSWGFVVMYITRSPEP